MSKINTPDPKAINFQIDDISNLSDVEKGIALDTARISLEERNNGGMRAYLISIELLEHEDVEIEESIQELGALVRSIGDDCVGVTVQKRNKIDPHSMIGIGKANEIKVSCNALKVDYVVCDRDLSPSQMRNLEKAIERPVLDRTAIILQIFKKNAKTREAKTQVDIARLEYLLPRLSNSWIAFERQKGAGGSGGKLRGAGETQIEIDRRRIREKVISLKKDLEKIKKERVNQRKSRKDEYNVVLVGYTNAGKTTIMNGLTDSNLSANNNLFETLDSSVRMLKCRHSANKILITDTVGFIRNLPHSLVASFRSTLEETITADLLLIVTDISNNKFKNHIEVTNKVLEEVGSHDVPRIYIFNKSDAVAGSYRMAKIKGKNYENNICISAENKDDLKHLKEYIEDYFTKFMEQKTFILSYDDTEQIQNIYTHTKIINQQACDNGLELTVRAPSFIFKKYFDKNQEPIEDITPKELNPWDVKEYSI